ncbi:MAG: hypothetical protein R3A11_06705 [Bdellovibrionota bacterium]
MKMNRVFWISCFLVILCGTGSFAQGVDHWEDHYFSDVPDSQNAESESLMDYAKASSEILKDPTYQGGLFVVEKFVEGVASGSYLWVSNIKSFDNEPLERSEKIITFGGYASFQDVRKKATEAMKSVGDGCKAYGVIDWRSDQKQIPGWDYYSKIKENLFCPYVPGMSGKPVEAQYFIIIYSYCPSK